MQPGMGVAKAFCHEPVNQQPPGWLPPAALHWSKAVTIAAVSTRTTIPPNTDYSASLRIPRLISMTALGITLCVTMLGAVPEVYAQSTTQCPGPNCTCGSIVTGKVVFVADMECVDPFDGLIVGADGTTIDLNGFRLQCKGVGAPPFSSGFNGSCQGDVGAAGAFDTDQTPEVGIDQNGRSNVVIKGSGSIVGWDIGVWIKGPANNITVEKLNVSGPDAVGGFFTTLTQDRPETKGVRVENFTCPDRMVRIRRNSVDNHTDGIFFSNAHCSEIQGNFVHDNNPGSNDFSPSTSHAIHLANSAFNKVFNNLVIDNGINVAEDAGIVLDGAGTTGNRIANNLTSYNNGDGILAIAGANGNRISNNTLALHTSTEPAVPSATDPHDSRVFYDLADRSGATNTWEANNVCETDVAPVPENVCNPGETTAPLH